MSSLDESDLDSIIRPFEKSIIFPNDYLTLPPAFAALQSKLSENHKKLSENHKKLSENHKKASENHKKLSENHNRDGLSEVFFLCPFCKKRGRKGNHHAEDVKKHIPLCPLRNAPANKSSPVEVSRNKWKKAVTFSFNSKHLDPMSTEKSKKTSSQSSKAKKPSPKK